MRWMNILTVLLGTLVACFLVEVDHAPREREELTCVAISPDGAMLARASDEPLTAEGGIYEQASVKQVAGRKRDFPKHLFGIVAYVRARQHISRRPHSWPRHLLTRKGPRHATTPGSATESRFLV